MRWKGNVMVFDDDEEIIEYLQKTPADKQYEGMHILSYMEKETKGVDYVSVFHFDSMIHTVYKFDKNSCGPEDAGLLLTISKPEHVLEQLNLWLHLKNIGMDIRNYYFEYIEEMLTQTHMAVFPKGKRKQ